MKLHTWRIGEFIPQVRSLIASRTALHSWMEEKSMERILSPPKNVDFCSVVIDYKDPETGTGFAMTEYWQEAATLMVAGADTPSHTIAATLYFLCKHPVVLGRVTQEVRQKFSTSDEIRSGAHLGSCSWLRASIDEAMRLSTPAPAVLPREVLPGGITICGEFFPAGVEVGISVYNYMHQASLFEDPETYDPTRWIVKEDGSNVDEVTKLRRHNATFSTGHRNCVGQNLALMEIQLTIARMLWQFDPSIVSEGLGQETWDGTGRRGLPEYKFHTRVMAHGDGPYMRFLPRETS